MVFSMEMPAEQLVIRMLSSLGESISRGFEQVSSSKTIGQSYPAHREAKRYADLYR